VGGTGLSAPVESGAAASSTGLGNVSSGDEVSLSGVSQILQSSSAQRTEALASLTSSVRAGSYNTSSADVGHSMISEILAQAAGR
jgi:anti-sigma28 factor (negative regulator of flagellin synthesis)